MEVPFNNRTQTTQIADHISNKATISFGLPQGFVLGPRLFLLYVNDIHQCSTKLKFYLFADDTNILFRWKKFESSWNSSQYVYWIVQTLRLVNI